MRGCSVETSRSAMPSSRQSATAAGFCTSIESGPPSTTQPSKRSVRMTPPARAPASSTRDAQPAALQLVGGGEAGDAAADDGDVNERRREALWTYCASICTCSTGVDGRMP